MHYGKLQGECVAAGRVQNVGEIPVATITGFPFNLVSVVSGGAGLYAVTLLDGIDTTNCSVTATCDTPPNTVASNPGGIDTDTVKNFTVSDAAGAPTAASGFYLAVHRTRVGAG